MKIKNKKIAGFSLLEILVVITVFAILGILTTQAVLLTIHGSKKTESLIRVRENLNFAMGIVERQLRNANDIPECPNPDPNIINYDDEGGNPASFSCMNVGTNNGYVASASAQLTNNTINITVCRFVCAPGFSGNPPSVTVDLTGVDKTTQGISGSSVSITNKIYLRNY